MGKSKSNNIGKEELPKRRGRMVRAKTYNKPTLLKLVSQPTNMVLWGTVAERYRIACGELEAGPAAVIKKLFVHKMCNNMRKITDSSGSDDVTKKCQTLNRSLHQMEEGDTFGNSDFEDEVSDDGYSDVSPNEDEDPINDDVENMNSPIIDEQEVKVGGSASKLSKIIIEGPVSDTKSKNAKPNPKSRLNIGKYTYI